VCVPDRLAATMLLIAVIALLQGLFCASAVNLRSGALSIGGNGIDVDSSPSSTIGESSFSTSFISAVDASIDRLLPSTIGGKTLPSPAGGANASLVAARSSLSSAFDANKTTDEKKKKKHAGEGILSSLYAAHGASELDLEVAVQAVQPKLPANISKLLKKNINKLVEDHQKKLAANSSVKNAGATAALANNAALDNASPADVEKAVEYLNSMIAKAQERLDAKTTECTEFTLRSEQTLAQISSDQARLGQESSNSARAMTQHMGGIDALTLNTQQAKEELWKEWHIYNTVREADLVELKERKANLRVGEFILDFTKCDGASAAMLQGASNNSGNDTGRLTSTGFQACVNGSDGHLNFTDQRLQKLTGELGAEGQRLLLRFALARESMPTLGITDFGMGMDVANATLQAAVLGSMKGIGQDLDDGDIDGEEEDDSESLALVDGQHDLHKGCADASAMQACDPVLERMVIPEGGACDSVPPSCCSCNKFYTTSHGNGNNPDGWCHYVPGKKTCQAGKWVRRHPDVVVNLVCQDPALSSPTPCGGSAVMKPPRSELKAATRCSSATFDCGVLHDLFASLWGEMKDLVEHTQTKVSTDTASWKSVAADINTLLQMQSTQMSSLQAALAEATSTKATLTDEQTQKAKESYSTRTLFDSTVADCKAVMKGILFTEICGVIAVRNNIISENLGDAPAPVDCKFSEWVAADCSVSCDDKMEGGTQELVREVITMNTNRGAECPSLSSTRKCNQIKCPVDCKVSEWAAFGKCTKECGGGVQGRTRSLDVKPKNGGQACDSLMETRPCNTGACDVDCQLGKWMPFGECTKGCNKGYMERRKRVLAEVVGEGTCLPANDPLRMERKPCNMEQCSGDEMCASKIDLVIALDASGSVTSTGFQVLKTFASKIVKRMKDTVQVGVVQFGNGKLDSNKVVSDAIVATKDLESNMDNVADTIEGLPFSKGFTNMAQAFMKAKDVLVSARKDATSVVLMITDGRPSFKFQTNQAVKTLRVSSRLMIVHVQPHRKQEIAEMLKGYASEPWSSSYKHIPGKKALSKAYDSYVTGIVADLCPKVVSPSALTSCTVGDGSGPSDVYPCTCGAATCGAGEVCAANDHFCMPAELPPSDFKF